MSQILMKLYLELSLVVPKEVKTLRDLDNEDRIKELAADRDRLAGEVARKDTALSDLCVAIHAIRGDLGTRYPALSEAWTRAQAAMAQPVPPAQGEAPADAKSEVLDDGFGNQWDAKCPDCGGRMEIVRPGKVQCSACDMKGGEA